MRGTHNVDGIADPVIDALVEDVIAANSRTDLLTACKALDRVIRSGRYWVPHWYKAAHLARKYAAELVALAPDVILGTSSHVVTAVQGATRSVPIVFVAVADPVGAGFIDSLARPGGNATGFTAFEYAFGGKWLELRGLIVTGSALSAVHHDLIVSLAARHRLPAVYAFRYFAELGGLLSYGKDFS
jgi:hypothetical protein